MGCRCCGGPLKSGTNFVTTCKYAPSGHVMTWFDSGLQHNAGLYFDGVYYELCAPVTSGNTILRTFDPDTGEEFNRRDMGNRRIPISVYEKGGNLYTISGTGSITYRIDKIDTTDLSSDWTFDAACNGSTARILIDGDIVIVPQLVASVAKWQAYSTGTTLVWSINVDDPDPGSGGIGGWIGVDSSGNYVGIGSESPAGPILFRYDTSGTIVDKYTSSVATSPGQNGAIDGSNIWVHSSATERIVRINSSLTEAFTPASVGPNSIFLGRDPTVVSGNLYTFGNRYVDRITSAGAVTQRFDHGATGSMRFMLVHGDQTTFQVFDIPPAASGRMRGFDDSSAPATLLWTMQPTLSPSTDPVGAPKQYISTDPSGNLYVTGERLSAATLDKVP